MTTTAIPPGRRRHLPYTIAALLLAAMAILLHSRQGTIRDDHLPLRAPMATFPDRLGPYVKVGSETLPENIEKQLGTTDYIVWLYHDTRRPMGEPGSGIRFHTAYWSGTRQILSTGLHAPEICYVGGGATVANLEDATVTLAKQVPGPDGSPRTVREQIPLRLFQFHDAHSSRLSNVGYFFNLNHRLLASVAWLRIYTFFGYTRNLFYCKIEAMPGTIAQDPASGECRLLTGIAEPAVAQERIRDFLNYAYPHVEKLLPAP
ncbi:MAG: exosortase-associated EpsI family protein [Lentisphaeria bacterium]|jgi:hypothetical protein